MPTIIAALVGEWRVAAHRRMRRTRAGALRGHPPQKGGAPAILAPARGKAFPLLSVVLPHFISLGFGHGIA